MTWNGQQGFQKPIADNSFIVDGVGSFGSAHTERGLTYVEVELSGHMYDGFTRLIVTPADASSFSLRIPQFAPWV
ncbi:hypothetical protein H0H87_003572 [Tephrocybe sp. NHM501043]|nr:hypothetical protein H0H87_003572 [Tephrocybe sp. NHM501043]